MHLKTEDISRLEIEYDSGFIPPPFSHIFKIKLGFGKKFIDTQLYLEYTHREDLTEEEILDEGFTLNDDFTYQGEIPLIWEEPIKSLYAKSNWSNKKLNEEEGGIKLLVKDIHGKIVRTIPANQQDWMILAQDVIQAIYELSKKEAPLKINYLIINDQTKTSIEVQMKFSIRTVDVLIDGKQKTADWEETKKLLSNVFTPDYDYGIAKEQKPTKSGEYIECGDGFWHDTQKGLINLDQDYNAVKHIREGFHRLIE
ncbi:hypothetical protein IPZ59_17570 [Mongoliitalea daihaiensis]|nr:hypothetical protein [Mongoliitalea daihaiensis]UJP67134.1 hypothetical protein IPZ59_17570 [Mongoliitalea daihaiensis]